MSASSFKERVTVLGGGTIGSVIVDIVANNVRRLHTYIPKVSWWIFHEIINGEKLSDIINNKHENVKYLPGKQLSNLIDAVTDIEEACENCTTLILCIPPKYIPRILPTISQYLSPTCKVVNVCKDLLYLPNDARLQPYSEILKTHLQSEILVLHGCFEVKNILNNDRVVATLGCENLSTGHKIKQLFDNSVEFANPISHDEFIKHMPKLLKYHKALHLRPIQNNENILSNFTEENYCQNVLDCKLKKFNYLGGAAPRTKINVPQGEDLIFTANEAPADQLIPFHHELAQLIYLWICSRLLQHQLCLRYLTERFLLVDLDQPLPDLLILKPVSLFCHVRSDLEILQ